MWRRYLWDRQVPFYVLAYAAFIHDQLDLQVYWNPLLDLLARCELHRLARLPNCRRAMLFCSSV